MGLWVGSVPVGTAPETLRAEFSKYGAVSGAYIKDTGQTQGLTWGFITFADPGGAANAMNAYQTPYAAASFPTSAPPALLAGEEPLQVRFSQKGEGATSKLWVGSVPPGTTQEALFAEFSKYGPVLEVFLKNDGQRQGGRMWGFVTMGDPTSAATALAAMNGRPFATTLQLALPPATSSNSLLGVPTTDACQAGQQRASKWDIVAADPVKAAVAALAATIPTGIMSTEMGVMPVNVPLTEAAQTGATVFSTTPAGLDFMQMNTCTAHDSTQAATQWMMEAMPQMGTNQ